MLFLSLQATTQVLQPVHLDASKWKAYCCVFMIQNSYNKIIRETFQPALNLCARDSL